jgi:hypothetical protein
MADLINTRRGFLTQLGIGTGVGIAGGLGLHRLLATDSSAVAEPQAPQQSGAQPPAAQMPLEMVSLAGPMLIHVRDVANAEVSMMVGTRELIYRDPELVSRLISTAQSADTKAEA